VFSLDVDNRAQIALRGQKSSPQAFDQGRNRRFKAAARSRPAFVRMDENMAPSASQEKKFAGECYKKANQNGVFAISARCRHAQNPLLHQAAGIALIGQSNMLS
jgi:hypothetical protein